MSQIILNEFPSEILLHICDFVLGKEEKPAHLCEFMLVCKDFYYVSMMHPIYILMHECNNTDIDMLTIKRRKLTNALKIVNRAVKMKYKPTIESYIIDKLCAIGIKPSEIYINFNYHKFRTVLFIHLANISINLTFLKNITYLYNKQQKIILPSTYYLFVKNIYNPTSIEISKDIFKCIIEIDEFYKKCYMAN